MEIIKKTIKAMCLLVAVTLAGCDNPPVEEELLLPGKNFVRITVANGLTTRAVRPIGNSNAANNVDHVQLVVYKKNTADTWVRDKSVEFTTNTGAVISGGLLTWTPSGDDENAWDVSHDVTQIVYLNNLTADTQYRIVGYGYNGDTEPFTKTEENGSFTTTYFPVVEEVFAGSIEPTTNTEGLFDQTQSLEMERQVAGMLARFKNVPAELNGTPVAKVVVKASHKASNIFFPQNGLYKPGGTSLPNTFNGVDMYKEADSDGFPVLTFNVSEINTGTATESGVYTFNSVTGGKVSGNKDPYAEEYTAVHPDLTLDGSEIFGACFLLPYDQNYSREQTLWIELQTEDGEVLKKLNVNVKPEQMPSGFGVTKNCYGIRRNHFYSMSEVDLSKNNVVVVIDNTWDGIVVINPS